MLLQYLGTWARVVTLLFLSAYAFFVISGTLNDWSENPVQTVIRTTNYPVQNVPFPALTVCQGENNRPLYFGFAETFFNYIRLQCDSSVKGDCEAVEPARKTFAFLLDSLEAAFRSGLQDNIGKTLLFPYTISNPDVQNGLTAMLVNGSKTLALKVIDDYESFYANNRIGKTNFDRFQTNMADNVINASGKVSTSAASQLSRRCLNDTTQDLGCAALLQRWQKVSSMSSILFTPLSPTGTLFRTFANYLKITSITDKSALIDEESPVNRGANGLLTGVLLKVLGHDSSNITSNASVSLLDVAGITLPGLIDSEINFFNSYLLTTFPLMEGIDANRMKNGYSSAWKLFLPGDDGVWTNKQHPCEMNEFAWFCKVFKSGLEENILETIKILKFSQPHFKTSVSLRSPYSDNLFFLEGSELLNRTTVETLGPWRASPPVCRFNQGALTRREKYNTRIESCDLLEPMWTDSGICGVFNALPFSHAFDLSVPTNDMFRAVYGMGDVNKTIYNIYGSGQVFSFSLLVDAHQRDSDFLDVLELSLDKLNNATFVVSIGSALNFFKVKAGNPITVKAGQQVNLRITPSQLTASDDIRNLPIDKRRCRLPDETEGLTTLFKYYTQSACKFECFIRKAAEFCRCVPASYPNQLNSPLCDYMGANCFSQLMYGNSTQDIECGCLPDCQQVTYSYSLERQDIDYNAACKGQSQFNFALYTNKQSETRAAIYKTKYLYKRWVRGINTDDDQPLCKLKIISDMAIVNVEIATDTIIVSSNVQKSSFEDKLAYVGGTIGLFNGMSFITIVDLIIIIVEFLTKKKQIEKAINKAKK